MKRDIPEKVTETLKDIGMNVSTAGWDCHGTFVLLHKALEKVAVKNKITFDKPEILECNSERRIASLIVTGHMGDKSEWSIGEASPSNNKNSYLLRLGNCNSASIVFTVESKHQPVGR